MIRSFALECRLAWRALARTPALAAFVVGITGIGAGMAAATYTVLEAVLVQPLPVVNEQRLIKAWLVSNTATEVPVGVGDIQQLRQLSRTMKAVAGVWHTDTWPEQLVDGDNVRSLQSAAVTSNFFAVLGATPILGRVFYTEDDGRGVFLFKKRPGSTMPIVISYSVWQRYFSADPSVVGRRLDDPYGYRHYEIIGVAPPGLDYPRGTDFWCPFGDNEAALGLSIVARMSARATIPEVETELIGYIRHGRVELSPLVSHAAARPLAEEVARETRPILIVIATAVGLLLLVACINAASLLILRTLARARELAIRRAIGATAGAIVRQHALESVMLAALGGLAGLLFSALLLRAVIALSPAELPRRDVIAIRGSPVGVITTVAAIALLVFGVVPAIVAARSDLGGVLRLEGHTTGRTVLRRRLRRWLVIAQLSLAVLLLTGAGLLVRSLSQAEHTQLGFDTDNLEFVNISYPAQAYDTLPKLIALGDQALERLANVPGVRGITQILVPPFEGVTAWRARFATEDAPPDRPDLAPLIPSEVVGSSYFATLHLRVLEGRALSQQDVEGRQLVVAISSSAARLLWPGIDPIGKRLRLLNVSSVPGGNELRTVVGIVDDVHFRSLAEAAPVVYFPWHQYSWAGWFAVKTASEPAVVLPAMRRALRGIDSRVSIAEVQSMQERLGSSTSRQRTSSTVLSALGVMALLLAMIGLFGVVASNVRETTREIGIRLALGATPTRVRQHILMDALVVAAIGCCIGLLLSLAVTRYLRSILYGVSPTDPTTLAVVSLILLVIAVIAAWIPAYRATRIDPICTLRDG